MLNCVEAVRVLLIFFAKNPLSLNRGYNGPAAAMWDWTLPVFPVRSFNLTLYLLFALLLFPLCHLFTITYMPPYMSPYTSPLHGPAMTVAVIPMLLFRFLIVKPSNNHLNNNNFRVLFPFRNTQFVIRN